MNENWTYEPEEPGPTNRGRNIFLAVMILGMILVAGVLFWALTRAGAPTGSGGRGGGSAAWVAILPAILGGGVSAAARRREDGTPANYTIPTIIIALVILLLIGVGLAVGFSVI